MVKTVPGGLQTSLEGHHVTLATLWKIIRTDGTVFTFTDNLESIPFNDGLGELTYESAVGYTRSNVESTSTMSVDNLDIQAAFDSSNITAEDLQDGVWDFAEVRIFLVDYRDISLGAIKIRRGWLGELSFSDTYTTELNGMLQILAHEIVELTSPTCRANFGEAGRCYIDIIGQEWSAALSGLTARKDFDARTEAAVFPTTPNDRWYITKTETDPLPDTGGSEPTWPTTIGATVNDNGILWEAVQGRVISVTVDVVTDQTNFTVLSSTDAPDAYFKAGFMIGTGGVNTGLKEGIASWDLGGLRVKFREPWPRLVSPGDTFTMHAGCIKDSATCILFDNKYNFRGEDKLPGKDKIFVFPDAPPAG